MEKTPQLPSPGNGSLKEQAAESLQEIASADTSNQHTTTILLWDTESHRRNLISATIQDLGSFHGRIETSPCQEGQRPDHGDIALIAVGNANDPIPAVWEMIGQLKRTGKFVIAYGDGVQQWPVRSKCRPLLAGAVKLLDSASPGFAAELRDAVQTAIQQRAGLRRDETELRRIMRQHGIVGESRAIMDVFRLTLRFSQLSDLSVLINGETGTGKELLAQAIHKLDPKRQTGPFVGINCAAIQSNLLESEFFGHRRGAFTGADRDRPGWIRAAEGGVLFLDEIGELELGLQAKLLRVLQENRVLGVGEERDVPVSVRFIAATNRNLEQLVVEGKFRADLLHRLGVLHLHAPALHERLSDLPLLVKHFLARHPADCPDQTPGMTADFLDALRQLEFPGNVRQLENIVRQSVVNHGNFGELDLADLPVDVLHQLAGRLELNSAALSRHAEPPALGEQMPSEPMHEFAKRILESQEWNLPRALRECERQVFEVALHRAEGNQSQAARLLGITPRSVYNKIRKHGLPA